MSDRPVEHPADSVVFEAPVTTTQQRCWFLDQIRPGNTALNIAVRWEIRGRFASTNLERAFQHVFDRHEMLRTRFVDRDGEPIQQVVDRVRFHLGELDLRTTPEADRMARIDAIALEEGGRPFDLSQPGLLRATLVRYETERAILLITAHQSAFDGYSIGVLGHEVGTAMQAYEEGRTPELPRLALQYGDYALWQRDYLDSGVQQEEGDWWAEILRDAPYFEITPDKPRPAQQVPSVGLVQVDLPPDFRERLEDRARAEGVTAFTFGTAVASAFLHRLSGEAEVLMGTQVAGRLDVDLEPLIGVFINNLVLRLPTAPETTLSEQVGAARQVVEGAIAHQSLPFNKLVERLNPPRDASRNPIISTNFNMMSVFLQGRSYGDFELVSVPSHVPGSVYDLQSVLIGRPGGWRLAVEYQTELFEEETARRMLDMLLETFLVALDKPDVTLGALPCDPRLLNRGTAQCGAVHAVEASLSEHPMVHEVAAVQGRGGVWAFVVPRNTGALPLDQLPGRLMEHLVAADLPEPAAGVSILAELPRNSKGGVNRSVLRPLAVPAPVQPLPVPATDPQVEDRLGAFWKDILSLREIPRQATFFDLGGHSLLAVRLLTRIRQEWGIALGIADIYENATLPALAGVISRHHSSAPEGDADDWRILRLIRGGGAAPLISINNAAMILSTSKAMEAKRPTTCVRLFDGTRGIDQVPRSFEEIAAEYARVIRKAQPEGPYLLFGVCVHGNIALEAARHLKAAGAEILGVVVKDVWEPGFAATLHANRGARWQNKRHALRMKLRMVRDGTMSMSAMLGSYRIVRATGVLQAAKTLGLIDRVRWSDLEEEQESFLRYISAARDRYRPRPLDLPVLHVVTDITPQGGHFPPSIGWENVVTGPLRTVTLTEVIDHKDKRIGVEDLAREIDRFVADRERDLGRR
ncbi:phosphopantetheine binding protein [Aliiruegeria haliotis]|uniref:Phosphopantetheine binding protein n=1 Tax=Aliiruegeria haliotis TaxID=1280846 RepID=A0A2T0RVT3_9RHOB|nr:condensation domain-containing protein [Aliiruegeria haliotis]PRY25163.1 phosphopantetheine binding protein [Aliiruegeria haliotis]